MLFIIASVAAAVAMGATTAESQSAKDRHVKRALAAADAAVDTATYRLNKVQPATLRCVVVGVTGLHTEPVQADGWCREQGEELGDGARFSYRMSAEGAVTANGQNLLQRKIVATGFANGVTRRVQSTVATFTGSTLFSGYALISLSEIELPQSTAISGDIGSNGDITLSNFAELCGSAVPGRGKSLILRNSATQCAGYSNAAASEPLILDPIDQGDAPTVNDNGRIGSADPMSSPTGSTWDPATRVLRLKNNTVLTLTGNVYSFCYLEVDQNAQIIIGQRNADDPVRIYIDSPRNCPGVANAGSVKFLNNSAIVNANAEPTTLRLYVVGDPGIPTAVDFNHFQSNITMVVYAPYSTVSILNDTELTGAVAAQKVVLRNSSSITWSSYVTNSENLIPIFHRQTWNECRTKAPIDAAPDAGC